MSAREDAVSRRDDLILTFLHECAARLAALTATNGDPVPAHGARLFDEALARSTPLAFEPHWVGALDTLGAVDATDRAPLAQRFVDVAALVPWGPTWRADDGGADLALASLDAVRDLGDLTVGIMYVRPGRQYPLHRHPPHELYLTISGDAHWRFGGQDDFRTVGPDTIIHNHPEDLHSAIAGATPLVALYVLWT